MQWKWYAHNIAQDEKEVYEQQLDLTEYLAMFWNKDAVQKIRDSRKARSEGMSDDAFNRYLEKEFGHSLDGERVDLTEDDIEDLIKEQKEREIEGTNYDQLEDLDEIRIVKPPNLNKDASQQ